MTCLEVVVLDVLQDGDDLVLVPDDVDDLRHVRLGPV
jgi:hypothetical protein